jgi:iron complex transport system substrate-binding protein
MPVIYPEVFPAPLTDEQVQEILASQEATPEATDEAQFPVTVVDATGTEITLSEPAKRIVCLTTSCLQDLAVLNIMPIAVWPDYELARAVSPLLFGENGEDLRAVANDGDLFDLEDIAALAPDLIVVSSYNLEQETALRSIAPTFFTPIWQEYSTVEELGRDFVALGTLTAQQSEAEAFVSRLIQRYEAYELERGDRSLRFAVIYPSAPEQGEIWIPGQVPLLSVLGENVATTNEWVQVTVEGLLSLDPEVMIYETPIAEGQTRAEDWQDVLLWPELQAVRNDRVLEVDSNAINPTSSLSLSNILDTLMPLLYPDLFPNGPLTDEQVQEILNG